MAGPALSIVKNFNICPKVAAQVVPVCTDIVGKWAMDTYGRSQMTVPRDTNFLANRGQVSHNGTEAEITYDTDYAAAVHEGTARMRSQPFLRNAEEEIRPGAVAALNQLERRLG